MTKTAKFATPTCARLQTATSTAFNSQSSYNNRISAQSERNPMREDGLNARCPYVGCVLARRHRVNRVNCTRTHQRCLRQQWNNVISSDESRFTIHRADGRVWVYCMRNARYANCCVFKRDRFGGGGGSILV